LALAGVPPDAPLDPTEPVDAADATLALLVDRLCADPGAVAVAVAAASASLPLDNDMPLTDEAADPAPLPLFPRVDEEGSANASSNTSADMLRPLPVNKKVVGVSCLDRRDVGGRVVCVSYLRSGRGGSARGCNDGGSSPHSSSSASFRRPFADKDEEEDDEEDGAAGGRSLAPRAANWRSRSALACFSASVGGRGNLKSSSLRRDKKDTVEDVGR